MCSVFVLLFSPLWHLQRPSMGQATIPSACRSSLMWGTPTLLPRATTGRWTWERGRADQNPPPRPCDRPQAGGIRF